MIYLIGIGDAVALGGVKHHLELLPRFLKLVRVRYGDGVPCDRGGNAFCVFVGSGIVDLDLSFGVTCDIEITGMFRIGMIGQEPSDQNTMMAGLGIRTYISPESLFKFFFGARPKCPYDEVAL